MLLMAPLIRVDHGMSSPSRHFPGNPMRRPQQLQVIIIHWTCGHVYWDPSPHEGALGALSILCSMMLPQVRSPRLVTILFVVYVVKQFSLIAYNSGITLGLIVR